MSLEAAAYNEARLARIAAESGSAPSLKISVPFFTSGTWSAPQDGVLEIRGMGAGGGGCWATSGAGTGGYSGAWGAKLVRVKKSDVVTVTIGAGGTGSPAGNTNGLGGGACTITVGGVTYTAPGGLGGRYAASGVPSLPAAPVLPAGWDIGANSVKPGAAVGRTGGAGVNILAQAGDATTSASIDLSGGGGTGAASSGTNGGGASPGGRSASGALPATPGVVERADNGEWVISFFGGGGGSGGSPRETEVFRMSSLQMNYQYIPNIGKYLS